MREGHPFDTRDLDDLRAEQRRALRLLPGALVVESAPRIGPDLDATPVEDRPLIESLLRAEARELLADRDLAKLIEAWRQQTQLEVLDDFYEQNRARAEQLSLGPQAAFVDQADVARMARKDREAAPLPVDHAPKFRRLLLLLVWADHLADYRDPRLVDLPTAAASPPPAGNQYEVAPPPGVPAAPRSGETTEIPSMAVRDA